MFLWSTLSKSRDDVFIPKVIRHPIYSPGFELFQPESLFCSSLSRLLICLWHLTLFWSFANPSPHVKLYWKNGFSIYVCYECRIKDSLWLFAWQALHSPSYNSGSTSSKHLHRTSESLTHDATTTVLFSSPHAVRPARQSVAKVIHDDQILKDNFYYGPFYPGVKSPPIFDYSFWFLKLNFVRFGVCL